MSKPYNPPDWFWIVNGSTTTVFSSKTGDYMPNADPVFLAWAADGTIPTRIASEDELAEVLAQHSIRPTNASVLDKFKIHQASKLTIEVVAKVLFNHENRLRTLQGQPTITPQQFANALKAML